MNLTKKACHYAVVFGDYSGIKELIPETAEFVIKALSNIDLKDVNTRRLEMSHVIVAWLKQHGTQEIIDNNPLYYSCQFKKNHKLEDLHRLQVLANLERLRTLELIKDAYSPEINISVTQGSYENMHFDDPDGVIYCDPPYLNKTGYVKNKEAPFNHEAFYLWCEQQKLPVYISSYEMPENRFLCIAQYKRQVLIGSDHSTMVTEKVFRPWAQL